MKSLFFLLLAAIVVLPHKSGTTSNLSPLPQDRQSDEDAPDDVGAVKSSFGARSNLLERNFVSSWTQP
jgi:hypothetical protein